MKTNVFLTDTLRQPFRAFLLLILFGLLTFGFSTKAVEFILIQRETEVLGSDYRSIGNLENIEDPILGDISEGIDLIQTSPYFAYGDPREFASAVMQQTYNQNFRMCNCAPTKDRFPAGEWPNVHNTDMWLIGDLIEKEALKTKGGRTVGYYLKFHVDTVLAAYPEYAAEGWKVGFVFLFKDHESSIPLIEEMTIGQRYFFRGWENAAAKIDTSWYLAYGVSLEIKPLDDAQLWYIPLAEDARIDFSDPEMLPFKQKMDILQQNLRTLPIIATADMSAMPRLQEPAEYQLSAGRWLNHQDDLDGNKVIVVPASFAKLRHLQLGDELQLTFRPLQEAYWGLIRDGVDSLNWKSYPTYEESFEIVGLYAGTYRHTAYYAFMPTNSLRPGFASTIQDPFIWDANYSFVLDSAAHEAEFVQTYKEPLQELGISLTFLENDGLAYWASVDSIRRSLATDVLIYGSLMVVALILAVFFYALLRKQAYANLRASGVPARQANAQFVLPLLLLGGLGIIGGGLTAWTYALDQAMTTLLAMPVPDGIDPSVALSPFYLAGLCAVIFLLLALFSWLGAFFLARKPGVEGLQGDPAQRN